MKELDTIAITANWGIFSGQALTISNIPVAFATAMAAAMIPTVAQAVAAKDVAGARNKISVAVKTTMVISIPCAVGLFVLAKPITNLLFPSNSEASLDFGAKMLMTLSLSVIFYALAALNSPILQGLGKVNTPIRNAGIALVIQTVAGLGLLFYTDLDLYSVAIANTLYSGIMCVLNQLSIRRAVGYKQEIWRTFVIPGLASVFMGAGAWVIYEILFMLTSSMLVSVIPAILVAILVYFVMMILMRGLTEQELRGFPKGYLLVKLAKKCRLMK